MVPQTLLVILSCLPATQQAASQETADVQEVRAFLERSASQLYKAEQVGLTGLSFRVPFEIPRALVEPMAAQMQIVLPPTAGEHVLFGDIRVSWSRDTEPQIEFFGADGLDPALQRIADSLSSEITGRGRTALDMALSRNADIPQLLRDFDATLRRDAGGLDTVTFIPKDAQMAPIARLVWYFDGEGVPVKTVMEGHQRGPDGPVTVMRTQTNHWRPASEDNESLVLEWAHTIEDGGPMGVTTSEITFDYGTFEGIVVLTGFTESNEAQELSFVSEVQLTDLQVQREGESR